MNLKPYLMALCSGILLLLFEVIGDIFKLDDFQKVIISIFILVLVIGTSYIVIKGGMFLLAKVFVNIIMFFTLLFLPTVLYNKLKR